jgi:hypothetical protein
MKDESITYKVHHITNLISTEEWTRILMEYLCFKKKLGCNQDLMRTLGKALEHLKINWLD